MTDTEKRPLDVELFAAYGLRARVFKHWYQMRLTHCETKREYDWFHTTGTVQKVSGSKVIARGIKDPEEVALLINEKERND